jgi:hypothetical protein
MAIKVIELVGLSEKSWEDAVQNAIDRCAKTVRHIVAVDVLGFKGKIEGNKIVEYRAHLKLAFMVE